MYQSLSHVKCINQLKATAELALSIYFFAIRAFLQKLNQQKKINNSITAKQLKDFTCSSKMESTRRFPSQ